jgi:hypothetical protein
MSLMVGDLCCNVINFIKSIGISHDISLRYLIISIILIGFVPPLLKYTLFPEGIEVENYSLRAFFYEKLCQKEDPLSKVINIVKQNTSTQDHIYVLGRLYELYPLTKRLPATVANGMDWYRDRDGDSFLVKNYNAIINSLRRQPPKVIILPCPIYRGIDLDQGPWEEIRNILREDYLTPKRLEWNSRMKFLTGKSGLVANVHEWVDVYFRK